MNFFEQLKYLDDLSELPEFILNHYRDDFVFLYGEEKVDEIINDTENKLKEVIKNFKKKGYDRDLIKREIFAIFQNFLKLKKERAGYFSQEALREIYEKAYKRVRPYIPNPEDFIGNTYSKEEVLADLASVEELEKEWEKDKEKFFSKTVELVVANYLESWLNSSPDHTYYVAVSPTAKPDDYGVTNPEFNKGFDFSLEFQHELDGEKEYEFAGATVDITTSEDLDVIRKKLNKIVQIIQSGKSPIIKYFENADGTYRGSVEVAPYLLITSHKASRDLLAKFKFNEEDTLLKHLIQYSLLEQMKQQTELFLALSREYHNKSLEKKYMMIHNHLNYVMYKKYKKVESEKIDIEVLKEKFFGTNVLMSELSRITRKK